MAAISRVMSGWEGAVLSLRPDDLVWTGWLTEAAVLDDSATGYWSCCEGVACSSPDGHVASLGSAPTRLDAGCLAASTCRLTAIPVPAIAPPSTRIPNH